MSLKTRTFIVSNIKLAVNASFKEAFSVAKGRLAKLTRVPNDAEYKVAKRSVDARDKKDVKFVYSVAITSYFPDIPEQRLRKAQISSQDKEIVFKASGEETLPDRPVVIGSGPCGIFTALLLAEMGYRPIVIERGDNVQNRKKQIRQFSLTRILDKNSNIQFGAGGAGTFSDGKLITRVADPLSQYVLKRFVEFGAPKEILYLAKPHIGTDVLSLVVENMLGHIESLGGEVMYRTCCTDIIFCEQKAIAVKTNMGDIPLGALVIAIGHSARDTYDMLMSKEFVIEPKPFSVGMRIEHLADDIDKALYGDFAGDERLGRAEYALSNDTKDRGVYTFCMCPGGEVIAATSEEGGVVTNGMSYHSRDGKNSNSAVLCSVFKEDYGATAKGAIEFQQKIERAAFKAGGGNYSAPIITVGDFLDGKKGTAPSRVMPTYLGGEGVTLADPKDYLPDFVIEPLKRGILAFDNKIKGFASADAILTGAETRTSAPIRILRDSKTHLAVGYDNVYPSGEGAGYAGGITSAAIDGLRTAMSIISRFRPLE